MKDIPVISRDSLQKLLSSGEAVNVVDVRPIQERTEWFIPGSLHVDAYSKLKQDDPTALDHLYLDKSVPVVTVCAAGKTSLKAAGILTDKGYKAYSLENGMKGWSLAWNIAHQQFDDFTVWQVRRTGKGCLSYIIASDQEAVIIDASLPGEVYSRVIDKEHLSVKYVIETHIHADHLSRSKEIADYYKVPLFLPAPGKVKFSFNPIDAATTFVAGSVTLQSIPTPGHTLDSFCFYIENEVLFTGDTLFTNGVGRPDLKSSEDDSRKKAGLLYDSLQKLISLPGGVTIFPAHTSTPVEFDNVMIKTTIEEAKKDIQLLKIGKEEFVNQILQKIPPAPPNYLAIVEKNLAGNYEDINPVDLEAGANRCAIS
jgi:glyoxylase-like metal-dependent hydrolase (beta-lactamase superfamily II)/rhodanese-related sulfurtransferase